MGGGFVGGGMEAGSSDMVVSSILGRSAGPINGRGVLIDGDTIHDLDDGWVLAPKIVSSI